MARRMARSPAMRWDAALRSAHSRRHGLRLRQWRSPSSRGRRRAACDVESVVGPAAVRSGERGSAALVACNQRGAQRADDGERDDHAGDDAHHRAGGFGPIGDRRGLRGGFRRISAAVGDAGFGRGGLAASGVGGVVIAVLPGGRVLRCLSGGGIGVRVRGRVACDPGCAARRALAGLCAGRLRGLRLLRGGVARGGLRRLGGRQAEDCFAGAGADCFRLLGFVAGAGVAGSSFWACSFL